MKVRAAIADARGAPLRVEGLELREPAADEILVKLIAAGVGRIDLDAIGGRIAMPLPFVPGSEGAGIIERVGGDVADLRPGDAVVVSFDFCGHCEPCVTGHPRACVDFAARNLSGRYLDGEAPFRPGERQINGHFVGQSSFATHLVCRAKSAVKVEKGAPLELFACLGGEMLMGAGLVLDTFKIRTGDSLVVSQADAIGLAAVMAAKASGADLIILADADERRRTIAAELGADVTVHSFGDLDDIVRSLAAEGVTFALETTGRQEAQRVCLDCLKKDGACGLVAPPAGTAVDFQDQLGEGRPLIVSLDRHGAPAVLIDQLLALRRRGALPLEHLIDFFPFEQVNDALEALRENRVVKPILRFPLSGFADVDRALVQSAAEDAPESGPQDEKPDVDVFVRS